MDIDMSAAINMQTASLRQAINTTMISKAVHQDAQSMAAILEMANVAQITGKGQHIDLSI